MAVKMATKQWKFFNYQLSTFFCFAQNILVLCKQYVWRFLSEYITQLKPFIRETCQSQLNAVRRLVCNINYNTFFICLAFQNRAMTLSKYRYSEKELVLVCWGLRRHFICLRIKYTMHSTKTPKQWIKEQF